MARLGEERGNAPSLANSFLTANQDSGCTSSHPNMLVLQLPRTCVFGSPSIPEAFAILPDCSSREGSRTDCSLSTKLTVLSGGNLPARSVLEKAARCGYFPGTGPKTPHRGRCVWHTPCFPPGRSEAPARLKQKKGRLGKSEGSTKSLHGTLDDPSRG